MGLESHLMNSFNLIYLFKDLMSKYSSILKYWGLGFNIWTGVEEQSLGERGSGIQPVELRACVHVCVCVCVTCVCHIVFFLIQFCNLLLSLKVVSTCFQIRRCASSWGGWDIEYFASSSHVCTKRGRRWLRITMGPATSSIGQKNILAFLFFLLIAFTSSCVMACGILAAWPAIKPTFSALAALNINHGTTREVHSLCFLLKFTWFP